MTSPTGIDYDRVAYPSLAHPQSHPANLGVKGRLLGLAAAPAERCRVLELGCSDGFNLAAMAAAYPKSHYTGIDVSGASIARGRAFLAEVGVTQVRLEVGDICALGEFSPPLGEFDYIIAHGLYSWVPAEVREALLGVISRLLAPTGIGFVSYLVLPGAYRREVVRSMMRFHARGETDPLEQVRQARSILNLVAKSSVRETGYTRLIQEEFERTEAYADAGLFHDELCSTSAPLLFTEFVDHAARYGLRYLCEAEYVEPVCDAISEDTQQALRPLESNRVLLEQYLDFIDGRRFRQTLLCRADCNTELRTEALSSLWVSSRARPVSKFTSLAESQPIEFHGERKAALRAFDPVEKAALLVLAARAGVPAPYPEIQTAVRELLSQSGVVPAADFDAVLRLYLCRCWLPGLVELADTPGVFSREVPERPLAHPLARWMLRREEPAVFNYQGHLVVVNGVLGRHLLSLLDGTRDRAALVAEMRAFLRAQHAAAAAQGQQAPLPPADDPGLPEQLERSLQGLAGRALFAVAEC